MASSRPHMILARASLMVLWLGLYQGVLAKPPATTGPKAGATAQQNQQFDDAVRAYREHIKKISAARGEYSVHLVGPLLGLGRSLIHLGDYVDASRALRRAQTILHRAQGVDSLQQLGIVDLLKQINMDKDKPLSANRQARFSMFISRHNYGSKSTDLLPAIYKLSNWYMRTGQYDRARKSLAEATKIIKTHYGAGDQHMIHVLELRAKTKRLQRICCSYRLLEQARNIVDSNTTIPADQKADVYTSLGDAYIADNKPKKATAVYEQAWQLLGSRSATSRFAKPAVITGSRVLDRFRRDFVDVYTEEQDIFGNVKLDRVSPREALALGSLPPQTFTVTGVPTARYQITEQLESVKRIGSAQRLTGSPFQFLRSQLLQILPYNRRRNTDFASMTIHLEFDVNAKGRASNIEVSGKRIPADVIYLMRKTVSLAKFRPRMVDGKPVPTKHVRLVQTFE